MQNQIQNQETLASAHQCPSKHRGSYYHPVYLFSSSEVQSCLFHIDQIIQSPSLQNNNIKEESGSYVY